MPGQEGALLATCALTDPHHASNRDAAHNQSTPCFLPAAAKGEPPFDSPALLVCQMNVMVETSGRDVGMYQYVDELFPKDTCGYRKLVVNFGINDIGYAERSVDTRMAMEMKIGKAAMGRYADECTSSAGAAIILANAGGPYGSAVLAGVQADSMRVWQDIVGGGEGDVGHGWFKASIGIEAREEAPWRAQARGAGVSDATAFEFGALPGK